MDLDCGLLSQRQSSFLSIPVPVDHVWGPRHVWGTGRGQAPLQRRHDALAGGHERPRCFLQFLPALTWLSLSSKVLLLGTRSGRLSPTFPVEAKLGCIIPLYPGLSVRGSRFL